MKFFIFPLPSHFPTSQSGQTFPSLHATRKITKLVRDRLWILTGCFNSKMEQALVESYKAMGLPYRNNRVFNNYSGIRPAEPTSVAIVATFHSLTNLMMHIIKVSSSVCIEVLPILLLIYSSVYCTMYIFIYTFNRFLES
jgi:hypothetical protein